MHDARAELDRMVAVAVAVAADTLEEAAAAEAYQERNALVADVDAYSADSGSSQTVGPAHKLVVLEVAGVRVADMLPFQGLD